MPSHHIRNIAPDDREEIARLIFDSLNTYYESIGRSKIFPGDDPLAAAIFFDVYQRTDPSEGIVAVDDDSDAIIASCFVHPRETHISLGIMNVHQDHFGRGLARTLLTAITDRGNAKNLPVRLVSSCLNLDSYSLYTRGGFIPFQTFQDMILEVPADGLAHPAPELSGACRGEAQRSRAAALEDVEEMAAIERELTGISRLQDYRYFIQNNEGFWHTSVIESENGKGLDGYLVSCTSPDFNMLGPGVTRTEAQSAALIHNHLDGHHRGHSPVFLAPITAGDLVATLYGWGVRNCEMHVAQSHGPAQNPTGIIMPTFLPETG